MKSARFRFYAELNDFLPRSRRQIAFEHRFEGRVSVKDMIESLGIPHTEVDLILAGGASVDFAYLVEDGDRITVYPVFETLDIGPIVRVRPHPLREPRFVLDTHLGKLATYLRMAGFDTLYRNDYDDEELAKVASHDARILLTRDRGLLKRSEVTHGYCVRRTDPKHQLVEVMRRFNLFQAVTPFRRCMRCNGSLAPVSKQAVQHRLPRKTWQYYDEFTVCQRCDQVYWKGSHYQRMQQFLQKVMALEAQASVPNDDNDG